MTYIEAMACGLPMVCRKDMCLKNVLDHGFNGFIFETEQEFIDSVLKILTDRQLQKSMSANALKRAKDNSDKIHVERVAALYDKVFNQFSA